LISIDSFGWIERFTKRPKTREYGQLIESTPSKDIVTSVVELYEVYKKIKKMKGEEEALLAVASLARQTLSQLTNPSRLKLQTTFLSMIFISRMLWFTQPRAIGKLSATPAMRICKL